MKKMLITISCFIVMFSATAQENNLNEEKIKKAVVLMKKMMTNPGEMQTVMTELQALKLSSAENKEARQRMQQQALSQMNSVKETAVSAGGKNEQQVRQQMGNKIPLKDAKKIAAIPATPSPANLNAYLQKLTKAVEAVLPVVIQQEAAEAFAVIKNESKDAREMEESVVGLWLSGHTEHAAIVAGKVCLVDISLAENINNYAAILNMLNAQHMAVPLLQLLNWQYPGNATILGNLGQSWYGLGDMPKAEKYLDSAIRFSPKHSQANLTKSIIQEQKGDKAGAAASIQASMETGYTDEKAARLRKLGFTSNTDVHWPLHIPQDPLGFNKFNQPAFPYDIEQSVTLYPEWQDHWKKMEALETEFGEDMVRLRAAADNYEFNALQKKMQAFNNGSIQEGPGPLSSRASAKLSYLLNDKDGGLTYKLRKAEKKLTALGDQLKALDDSRDKALEDFEKEQRDCGDGEGSSGAEAAACCETINQINNTWLTASNKLAREAYEEAIDLYKRTWSAEAYFAQYTMSEPSFEALKAQYKHIYAGTLAAVRPRFAQPSLYCNKKPVSEDFKPKPLKEYDDVACKYYSRLKFGSMVIESNCSRMKTSVDFGKLKFSFTEDMNKATGIVPGSIIAGSVDVSISIGNKGLGKWGPVKVEAGAGVDLHIEVNDQGISEVSATVKAEITVGTDLIDKAEKIENIVKKGGVEYMKETGTTALVPIIPGAGNKSASIAGAAATISLNSGSSVSGSGALSGLKL